MNKEETPIRLQLSNISILIDNDPSDVQELTAVVAGILKMPSNSIRDLIILKRSIDARKKSQISFIYTVEFSCNASKKRIDELLGCTPGLRLVQPVAAITVTPGAAAMKHRPVVIGSGPAGLFSALILAEQGYNPVILERGDKVDGRTRAVAHFWETGELDPESNVQFGEGGAGTFSDGKLTTRIKDERIGRVLREMVEAGAHREILYEAKPHVGTDVLARVVTNIRKKIEGLGGEFRFRTRLADIRGDSIEGYKLDCAVYPSGEHCEIPADIVVLAIGNSARDTFEALHRHDIALAAKPISVGVRVEHYQDLIDAAQYGQAAGHRRLGAADYQLSYRDEASERAVYTFCMCPGGRVIAAASEFQAVVTNGMSYSKRDSGIANSAVVVSVGDEDYGESGPLAGVQFQRRLEHKAYLAGGGGYKAPYQSVRSYLGLSGGSTSLKPTYRPGCRENDLSQIFPRSISDMLKKGFQEFDKKVRGFISNDAIITGVETRTSSPVRIVRNDDFTSVSHPGLYPAGEGAGYAGGITSAAVDGIRVAEAIVKKYSRSM